MLYLTYPAHEVSAERRGDSADFAEILDASFPWDSGSVFMLTSYFDASKRNSGVLTVAGVAFGIDRAKKADREWRSAFDGRRLHMADLHGRYGDFKGISGSDADRYCRTAVGIINRFASKVVAVSCDIAEVERLRPKGPSFDAHGLNDSVRSAYNCGLHWSMMLLGGIVSEEERIQHWFELGDEYQSASHRFLSDISGADKAALRRSYRHHSHVFAPKADVPLFDAADLVAWEWGKHIERLREGRHVRPSLIALMGGDACVDADGWPCHKSANRAALHSSGWKLERFFRKMAAIMVARSPEEVDAAVRMS